MMSLANRHIDACERMLARDLAGLAAELREIDAADIVAWVHGGRVGTVASIIGSAIELIYVPGAMRFALSGDVVLAWAGGLVVRLEMELHQAGVDCYFRLHVGETHAGVDITFLSIDGAPCQTPQGPKRFAAAMRAARRRTPAATARRGRRNRSRKPCANKSA